MKTIYRIQDKDGRGPWKPGFSHKWVESRPDHDNLLPWNVEFGRVDRCVKIGESMGCGCETKEQLKRWFTETEYETLKKHGYKAVKMNVNNILCRSDIQVVFSRRLPLRKKVTPFKLYK